jgi:hypothetical protein
VLAWEIHPNFTAAQIADTCRRTHEVFRSSVNA